MIAPVLSFVLPYYNEANYLEATLASLAAQTHRDFVLILANNASDDNSEALCRALTADWEEITVIHSYQSLPGKIHALKQAIGQVGTALFATVDADTLYPPDYAERIIGLFAANPEAAMVMAADIYGPATALPQRLRCWGIWALSRLFPLKCHTGAFGHAFRTEIFRRAGGYDERLWKFVLEDHEIIHRLGKKGHQVYSAGHYCSPSPRRQNRRAVSWTRGESLLYTFIPNRWMDWFFYDFLAKRFSQRGLDNRNLRERTWE